MKIKNHRLYIDDNTPADFKPTPDSNKSKGKLNTKFLVIHYTAGANKESSVNWFLNPAARASAHLVIGRDGSITQMVPFNEIAYHAGPSYWHGYHGLNQYSIGIELDNAGKLSKAENRGWRTWFDKIIPEEEILIAPHRHEIGVSGWQTYTKEQIEATINVSLLLNEIYKFHDVVGHDDISPNRKQDPGPAFPLGALRSKVLGRNENTNQLFKTTTKLNIRSGPSIDNNILAESPLPKGTKMIILDESHHTWHLVDIVDPIKGVSGLQGWVHGRYIQEA